MTSTFLDLEDKPCADTIRLNVEKAIHTVRQRNCRSCSPTVPAAMREFGTLLMKKVEELISEVKLDLDF